MRLNLKPIWQTGLVIAAAAAAVVLITVEVAVAIIAIQFFTIFAS